jgi:hypothetical protein
MTEGGAPIKNNVFIDPTAIASDIAPLKAQIWELAQLSDNKHAATGNHLGRTEMAEPEYLQVAYRTPETA